MKNTVSKITAIIMLIYISAVMLLIFFGKGRGSDMICTITGSENNEISAADVMNGQFTNILSAETACRFPGRCLMISADSRIRAAMNESIVNGVYVDKRMLLDAGVSERGSVSRNADIINNFCNEYKGTVYFAAIPTSAGVYESYMPEYLRKNSESMQINRLYTLLEGNIREIDAYNILKMLNENYIYYRNDSRWTSYGAYCVYRTVIQKLGYSPVSYDKYTIYHVSDEYRGDLYTRTFYSQVKPDIIDIYSYPDGAEITGFTGYDNKRKSYSGQLFDRSFLESGDMYDMYMGEHRPLVKIRTSVSNERRILVIKDSFADCFIPFLTQHYSEIDVVSPEYMKGSLRDFVDPDDYEQILFIFGIDSMDDKGLFDILAVSPEERKNR